MPRPMLIGLIEWNWWKSMASTCVANACPPRPALTAKLVFRNQISVVIEPKGHSGAGMLVRNRTALLYTKAEPFVMTFLLPVKGFEISIRHPASINPSLYVFGIGGPEDTDPLQPKLSDRGFHQWRFGGWMLQNSGFA